VNNRTNDIQFHPGKDEYICVYFRSEVSGITRDRLRIEIDGYGAPALVVVNLRGQEWQANLRVPPGLADGTHDVRLRTTSSPYSNAFQIVVGRAGFSRRGASAPLPATNEAASPSPVLYEVTNGMTDSNLFRGHRNEYVCCRFRLAVATLDRTGVILEIDEAEQSVLFLTDLGGGCWQVNSPLPRNLTPGSHSVRIRTIHSGFSNRMEIART
jgi:hypothetical protein